MSMLNRHRPFTLFSLLTAALMLGLASPSMHAADAREQVLLKTSKGDIVLELYADQAPETVKNFLRLVDSGFYTDLIFHRVIPGFMIQTGGYDARLNFSDPPRQVPNESDNALKNLRGFVAMARKNDPDSATSQFYINVRSNPSLDPKPGIPGYTVFGRVISGMEVVVEIENTPTQRRNGMADVPVEAVVITSAKRL